MILVADPDRYSSMIRGLNNASLADGDEWTNTVTEACNYLSKWEGYDSSVHVVRDFKDVAFTNDTM
jgi:hypothetical protein